MSSCVATQPPSAIGRLMTQTMRPSADFTSVLVVLPSAMVAASVRTYSTMLPEKVPLATRYSSRLVRLLPGLPTVAGSRYRS